MYNPVGARLIVRSADLSARFAHIDDFADKSALRTINRAPTGLIATIINAQ